MNRREWRDRIEYEKRLASVISASAAVWFGVFMLAHFGIGCKVLTAVFAGALSGFTIFFGLIGAYSAEHRQEKQRAEERQRRYLK